MQDNIFDARYIASINTFSIWIIGSLFYLYYKHEVISDIKVGKHCFFNSLILVFLAIISRVLAIVTEHKELVFAGRTLSRFADEANDWRLIAFLDYPTMVAGFAIMMYPGAIYYICMKFLRLKKFFLLLVYHVLILIPVYYSFSRSGYLLMAFMMFSFILIKLKKICGIKTLMSIALIFMFALLLFYKKIIGIITHVIMKLWLLRQGSNNVRFMIYKTSFDEFMKNPILGYGIKIIGPAGYPLGSHNTYLGFLFKTGILGTIVIVTGFLLLLRYINKRKQKLSNQYYTMFVLMIFVMLLFFVFEDMDGADWQLCMWLSILGFARDVKLVRCCVGTK